MELHKLIANIPDAHIIQSENPLITGLSIDSRTVQPGDLFVAIRGGQIADRHAYVPQAVAAGAGGVVVEEPVMVERATAVIQVPSARHTLGILAERFYGSPGRALRMVGVTGTNGKTTTTTLIHAILDAAGWRSGLIGTVEYRIGDQVVPSYMTTPDAHEVQRMLREMVDSGCQAAVLEVSSHGLALERVARIPFDIAVFTNLTRDHLDFHGTLEAYRAAKALLFEQLNVDAHAVVNVDDPATDILLRNCKAQVVGFGRSNNAEVRLLDGHTDWNGTRMSVLTPVGRLNLTLALRGRFHQQNVLAAVGAGIAMGIAPEVIVEAVREVRVSGRFEAIDCGQDFGVIVDSGHTPDALEKILISAREFTKGQLICVFGCDGDRDRGKRPQMGRIAAELSDLIVVTSGHPHTEDPETIIQDILPGLGTTSYLVEPDRRKAITLAIRHAATGDGVVIAGKAQVYQIVGQKKLPFDDREVAQDVLEEELEIRRTN